MAVLPPTHEERLAALSVSDELRAVTIDRARILEGVGGDEALVDAMLALFVQQVKSSRSGLWAAADAADNPLHNAKKGSMGASADWSSDRDSVDPAGPQSPHSPGVFEQEDQEAEAAEQ